MGFHSHQRSEAFAVGVVFLWLDGWEDGEGKVVHVPDWLGGAFCWEELD